MTKAAHLQGDSLLIQRCRRLQADGLCVAVPGRQQLVHYAQEP